MDASSKPSDRRRSELMRLRVVGICLVTLFALGAIFAAGAQAKHPKRAKFELFAPGSVDIPYSFVLRFEHSGLLQCRLASGAGEITGPKAGTVIVRLSFCEGSPGGGGSCGFATEGPITTRPLALELGYVKAPGETGIDLKPTNGGVLAEFGCPAPKTTYRIEGSVIATIFEPLVDRTSAEWRLAFQGVEAFEGGVKDTLVTRIDEKEAGFGPPVNTALNSGSYLYFSHRHRRHDPIEVKTGGPGGPEFGRCRPLEPSGKYLDSNCSEEHKNNEPGKYEFFPIPS